MQTTGHIRSPRRSDDLATTLGIIDQHIRLAQLTRQVRQGINTVTGHDPWIDDDDSAWAGCDPHALDDVSDADIIAQAIRDRLD